MRIWERDCFPHQSSMAKSLEINELSFYAPCAMKSIGSEVTAACITHSHWSVIIAQYISRTAENSESSFSVFSSTDAW